MKSPKYQPVRETDPEHFRLSSLDEESRPTKLLEQKDEEAGLPEDALLPTQEEAKPKRISITMFLWILINTLATIGIVSIVNLAEE